MNQETNPQYSNPSRIGAVILLVIGIILVLVGAGLIFFNLHVASKVESGIMAIGLVFILLAFGLLSFVQ